ncbi:MAG: 50S ribosomal protein L11 methyltransferase, partial [Acidimicrobiales bacterium]|nr:50S ribosomal protein L11 methyltransferase [Acidimicrobiales bacterium]
GCGSGVLAIAALALGAGTAVGVDVDPAARSATAANAGRNRVADRLAVVDDVARAGGRYDLVVANLLLPQHRSVAHAVAGVVAEGGRVVVSGVLAAQRAEVEAAYRSGGLDVRAHRADDGWLALTLAAR